MKHSKPRGVLASFLCIGLFAVAGSAHSVATAATSVVLLPKIMYLAGGHLWIRPVSGGTPLLIRTPWPMGTNPDNAVGVQWSPDGRRVALDDGRSRLAVINLVTGHQTVLFGHRCTGLNCSAPAYAWSPNARYLAIVDQGGNASALGVWDSSRGTQTILLGGVTANFSGLDWSHDSQWIVVETGKVDFVTGVLPTVRALNLNGQMRTLGKGAFAGWSADDRFVAVVHSNQCGANTCDDNELVRRFSGGPIITLAKHVNSNFENTVWAPQPAGYAFDRWLLGPNGHIARRLTHGSERTDSWSPDGSHVALQTYYPYYSTPDTLFISTPGGKRVHLYTDGRNAGCGACSKDVYGVTWAATGRLIAFTTPEYPTPKFVTAYPKAFLTTIDGGPLTRIPVPGTNFVELLGFVDNDQELVIRSGRKIYRYVIATHSLTTIATGVTALAQPSIYPTT
jgi:Tol biopolymer transport system component